MFSTTLAFQFQYEPILTNFYLISKSIFDIMLDDNKKIFNYEISIHDVNPQAIKICVQTGTLNTHKVTCQRLHRKLIKTIFSSTVL